MRRLLLIAAGIAALAGAFLLLSQRYGGTALKPELEAFLSERTGLATTIDGELRWHYLWPTAVTIEKVRAVDAPPADAGPVTEAWTLDSLRLELDTSSVLSDPGAPARWTVKAFQVEGLRGERGAVGTRDAQRLGLPSFWIRGLRPGTPAPFSAELRYETTETGVLSIDLAGRLRFVPDERRMVFEPLKLGGNVVAGVCQADVALKTSQDRAAAVASASSDGVLDLLRWRTTDWGASCELDRLTLGSEDFSNTTLRTQNLAGAASLTLAMPAFFGGTANLKVVIDGQLEQPVPKWHIAPTISGASSARLLRWAGEQRGDAPEVLPWNGPIELTGLFDAVGNDRVAIINSGVGKLEFLSAKGRLDLREFKRQANEPLEKLGSVLGERNLLGSWPDDLNYSALAGEWRVDRGAQNFSGQLDNLKLKGSGTLQPAPSASDDLLTLNGSLVFEGAEDAKSLPVNALLEDVPLPFRCEGSTRQPACSVDGDQAKTLVADALSRRTGELADKLDQIIDEKVPKEYQRAARGLLEIFSKSVEDEDEASDVEFLSGADDVEL